MKIAMLAILIVFATIVIGTTGQNILVCHCDSTEEVCHPSNKSCTTDGMCFTSVILASTQSSNEILVYRYGCLDKKDMFPREAPFVCGHMNRRDYATTCCRNYSFCNIDYKPTLFSSLTISGNGQTESPSSTPFIQLILIIVIPTVSIVILLITCVLLWRMKHKILPRISKALNLRANRKDDGEPMLSQVSDGRLSDLLEISSGSGLGSSLLVQRTIARQIKLEEIVGKGRYGEVWRGSWRGENVAVKIFNSRQEQSWFREVEIYMTVMLRHANVLGFVAADNKDSSTWTQLYLVTDYHQHGSLFDFLSCSTVDVRGMIRMIRSIASGLCHLHLPTQAAQDKPKMAHRDLKSKNILVKDDGECCIADLGLSVKEDATDGVDMREASGCRVGTVRYMAPEILDESIDSTIIDSFQRADIYSFSLVIWEVLRRTTTDVIPAFDYELPYYDVVQPDPTVDEMKEIVSIQARRPTISNNWQSNLVFAEVSKLMADCWYQSPPARVPSLRILKNMKNLEDHHVKAQSDVHEKKEVETPSDEVMTVSEDVETSSEVVKSSTDVEKTPEVAVGTPSQSS